MNDKRRGRLGVAVGYIEMAKNVVKEVRDEEETAFYNLPENLQCSDKGCDMEDKVTDMDDVIDSLDDIISSINDITFKV